MGGAGAVPRARAAAVRRAGAGVRPAGGPPPGWGGTPGAARRRGGRPRGTGRARPGGALTGMGGRVGHARRVAVIVEPAHPARIAPLLMSAYGLTGREQEVTRLVLQGNSTSEIAQRLVVSANTVQQHLKSIFGKTA